MSAEYNGFEFLLNRFKEYQKESPKGISLKKNRNTINLQFEVGDRNRKPYGCNCSFTLNGMDKALNKARKVAEKLQEKELKLSEFDEWYDREIKDIGKIEDDTLIFSNAIAVVETDFWRRPDRRKNKRIKNHPNHESSWNRTYFVYYKYLPQNKLFNLSDILKVLKKWEQGSKQFKDAVSAFRKLAEINDRNDVYKKLKKINSTQTIFQEKQEIDLEEFIKWRNKILGITEELNPRCHLDIRKAWLWVFGIQIIYGLRIAEVFAIKNLDKPVYNPDTNKLILYPYNDLKNNPHKLIYVGNKTNLNTTVKTGDRPVKPMESPKYPNLYYDWNLHNAKLPTNKPSLDSGNKTIACFHANAAGKQLRRWNAPFTQTHADRRLGNLLGIQSGMSDTDTGN